MKPLRRIPDLFPICSNFSYLKKHLHRMAGGLAHLMNFFLLKFTWLEKQAFIFS